MRASRSYVLVAPAVPLFVAAVQPALFPLTASLAPWFATFLAVLLIAAIVVVGVREGQLSLFRASGPMAALMRKLLLASAVVPMAADAMIEAGRRSGFYSYASAEYLHALGVTVIFVIITLEVGSAIYRIDGMRQQTEEDARRAERRHRELLDNLPHIIYSLDNDDRFTGINLAGCQALGLPEAAIIGRTPEQCGVPADVARDWKGLTGRTRLSGINQVQTITVSIAGRERHLRAMTSPIRDANGAIAGVSGITFDETEQKTTEATMQRLLQAFEQLDEIMFTTDRDGTITYVNRAFEEIYGFSRGEAIGKTPRILKSGEIPLEGYQKFWAELLAGHTLRSQYRNRKKDGSLIDVVGSATPVVDMDGTITGFIAIQSDITAQKKAEEEQKRLDERLNRIAKMESLGTLAAGIAHDVNNILGIILAHITLVERRQADAAAVARASATIKQAVQRGASLSRQILTFARRAEINAQSVAVANLIMELGSMVRETFPRTIQVTLRIDPDLPLIHADGGQMHQALLNLCVNARDAMPNGGELSIEAKRVSMDGTSEVARAGEYVAITVGDTGTGMDDEIRRRIFEPFFTTKEKGKGTGLGLAMVYGVLHSHDGFVDVQSAPGKGSRFSLFFPLSESTVKREVKRVDPHTAGHGTLLVIDDEPDLLEALSAELRSRGYEVIAAANGPQAIEACRTAARPDAVLMDLGMPKMPAADVIRSLRQIVPGVPVIAITGYVDADVHASVAAAGVQRVVQKPFSIDDLIVILHEALEPREVLATV